MTTNLCETGWVIARRDNTGVLAYWTGKAEWAFSVEHMDAVRFQNAKDAQRVLDNIVLQSEGYRLHVEQFPDDTLRIEEHLWCY